MTFAAVLADTLLMELHMIEAAEAVGTMALAGALVALFSSGIAFWLIKSGNARSPVHVSTISAASASGILTLVPIVTVVADLGLSGEFWIVLVVMIVSAMFMAAVTGFPAALYVARKISDRPPGSEPE